MSVLATYTVPSTPSAGVDTLDFLNKYLHTTLPLGFIAYTELSCEATYTIPAALTAGEPSTLLPVDTLHSRAPVTPFSAYKLLSSLPTYTAPLGPTAGEEYTVPDVAYVHMDVPVPADNAYTLKSSQPTYRVDESMDRAGEDRTLFGSADDHRSTPLGVQEYTWRSSLPT